ncbi:glycosyltransferase family 4 protein [Bacteroidota bacterium]
MLKPNILFINYIKTYAGGEIWMITLAKELLKKGYKVTLVCPPDAEMIEHTKESEIEVHPIKMSGDFNPKTIFQLKTIFKQSNINIVFANVGKDIRLAGLAAKFITGVSVIALHQVDRAIKNNLRYRFTYNFLADIIIVNSLATKNTMMKSAPWLIDKKIQVVYHGIDAAKYNKENATCLRNSLGLVDEDFIIGFVGRLNVQKGIKYMLDAFKLVTDKYKNAHLLIAGTGDLENTIRDFASKFNLENKIHLLGFRTDIHNLMRAFDVFLLPSLWEGFGIVLIEAMAAGKACVATSTSSIPEIVEDGISGILVPPENAESIADALKKLISDPIKREEFGKEGQKIVQQKFTIERMINDYEKLFQERIT